MTVLLAGCEWCTVFDNNLCECQSDVEQCEDDASDTDPDTDAPVAGLNIAFSESDIASTHSRLRNRITARQDTYIVERVDYGQQAAAIGETLATTGVIVFAAPRVAVPLIQANPLAGLSLPQAMAVYRDDDDVAVAFNNPAWLRERYALGARSDALAAMDELLTLLAQRASLGSVTVTGPTAGIGRRAGVVVRRSNAGFDDTVARLNTAIRTRNELDLVETFDHEANAARIGSNVNPARLFLFLDIEPELDLLRARQSIAVNLPLRMLVYVGNDDAVHVAYNDPAYLAERHGVDTGRAAVAELSDVLETLADAAASGP